MQNTVRRVYRYYLSVIIPAYNEEKKIEKDIREVFSWFKKNKVKGEVIVSTDGVTDRTNEIVRALHKEFETLTLLSQQKKIGKGAAIRKGVKEAAGKYIMFADAGYCVPFRFIGKGIEYLEKGYDISFGSRGLRESVIVKKQPFYRIVGSVIFGIIVRKIMGIPSSITDTQCGFKFYTRQAARFLFRKSKIPQGLFDLEIILLSKRHQLKIAEFPVAWTNDEDTKFNLFSGSLATIRDLFLIKFIYKL